MAAKTRWENLAVLYDRMTPAAQSRLIDRFIQHDLDGLVKLTTLRSKIADAKRKTRGSGTGTDR